MMIANLVHALLATGLALAEPGFRAPPAVEQSKRILLAFDDAWAARDVDAMMAHVSPKFGCNFYGGIRAEQLRKSFSMLLEALPATRCETTIVRISALGSVVQAYVHREFFANPEVVEPAPARRDDTLETQRQVIYLSGSGAALQIVALEDYDPATLDLISDGRFSDPRTGLALALPEGMFVVAAPRFDSLVRLVIRGDDLHGEILLSLDLFADPFQLEPAFDHDLREWKNRTFDGDISRRRELSIAGHPALRAEGTYTGGACSLRPEEPDESLPRSFSRIYVQPDPSVLFAVLFDADSRLAKRLSPKLEAMLASVRFSATEGKSYGDSLRKRLGYGPVAGGIFRCGDSGFEISAPPEFTVERVPSAGCFRLELRRASDSLTITLEASRLIDPDCDPGEIAEDDDEAFLDAVRESAGPGARVGHARVELGTMAWLRADRAAGPRGDPTRSLSEFTFYTVCGPYMLTAEASGGTDETTKRAALETVLRSIHRSER